jgi:hypothetical protein
MTRDIVVDELSELLVHNYQEVYSLLSLLGIKANANCSDEELIEIIIENSKKSEKLTKGLGFLIAKRNGVLNQGKQAVDFVSQNFQKTFTPELQNTNSISKLITDLINRIKVKAEGEINRNRQITKSGKYWRKVLVVGLLVVGGYMVIKYIMRQRAEEQLAAQMGNGGVVAPVPTVTTQKAQINHEPINPEDLRTGFEE